MIYLKEETMKSPIALLESLADDFARLDPDVKGLKRDLKTLELRYEHEGYGFLSVALPALRDAFLLGLSRRKFTCPAGFKLTRGGTIPRLFSGMFCEVFESSTGQLKEDASIGVIKSLFQVLSLFKKTQMSDEGSEELHLKAVAGFFSTDEVAQQVVIPERESFMLSRVGSFCLPNIENFKLEELDYKHGPGAVVEGLKANQKWAALSESILNDDFRTDLYGYDCVDSLRDLSIVSQKVVNSSNGASRGIARLVTVPKNSTSRRTITVEPLLKQFFQQGLNTTLRREILKCGILSNCLALTDQSKNQQLALEGSLTDEWSTIDLRSASDLISMKLVKKVFGHHASFFDALIDCRSTSVTDGVNKTVDVGKFAGMGNATTFPVQSIIFALISICAILDVKGKYPSYKEVERASRHVRVYGDDIIVRRVYAHQVVIWLQRVGLQVNEKKSFIEGNFKESCGVEAYAGVDITPVYIRYRPDDSSTDPSLAHFVSLSNQCWLDGYYAMANKLAELVEGKIGNPLPLVKQASGGLGWHTRQDACCPHLWNNKLHRFETSTYVIKPRKRRDILDGIPALLKFFHVPLEGRQVNHLQTSEIRYKSQIVRRRVPAFN